MFNVPNTKTDILVPTEKCFRSRINLNRNQIVFTKHRLIWNSKRTLSTTIIKHLYTNKVNCAKQKYSQTDKQSRRFAGRVSTFVISFHKSNEIHSYLLLSLTRLRIRLHSDLFLLNFELRQQWKSISFIIKRKTVTTIIFLSNWK